MLFYRTDIFADLHIDPPSTWEEFYETLNILQQNNLQVAIPETDSSQPGVSVGIATFNKFLYQSGESYFNEDLSATRFDSPKAVEAFEKWTELYTRYSLEREVNFYNRFPYRGGGDGDTAVYHVQSADGGGARNQRLVGYGARPGDATGGRKCQPFPDRYGDVVDPAQKLREKRNRR